MSSNTTLANLEASSNDAKSRRVHRPLLVLFAVMVLSLVAVAASRLMASVPMDHSNFVNSSPSNPLETAQAPVVQQRTLLFKDAPNGDILVFDVTQSNSTNSAFSVAMEPLHITGEQGFLRGALRALVRERRLHGLQGVAPFELAIRSDKSLTLADPSTSTVLHLEAFGPSNLQVFKDLMSRLDVPGKPHTDSKGVDMSVKSSSTFYAYSPLTPTPLSSTRLQGE